jgi:alanine-glyoxylate transaminase / serine-glyoxylate transaminase / serine-pyruvate transaminase
VRKRIHERFDLSLRTGLGKVKGRMLRIGYLGDCNDLTLLAALAALAGSGVAAAVAHFAATQ